jgi:hypothetical protein
MSARLATVALAAAACAFAAPALAQHGASSPCSGAGTVSTATYVMTPGIGGQEEMYLPSEVKARHIKNGEIMLGGEMSMVQKTAGTKVFHLEVHICTRSGAVAKGLKPVIMVDSGTMMSAMKVPAAIMVGIGEPSSDYHYGNDVALKPGDKLTVKVTVKGQTAVLHITAPK